MSGTVIYTLVGFSEHDRAEFQNCQVDDPESVCFLTAGCLQTGSAHESLIFFELQNDADVDVKILNELGVCITVRLVGFDVSHSVRRGLLRSSRNLFNICKACKFLSRQSELRIAYLVIV